MVLERDEESIKLSDSEDRPFKSSSEDTDNFRFRGGQANSVSLKIAYFFLFIAFITIGFLFYMMHSLENSLEQIQTRISSINEEVGTSGSTLLSLINSLDTNITELKETSSNIQNVNSRQSREINSTNQGIDDINLALSNLQISIDDLYSGKEELNEQLNYKSNEIENLNNLSQSLGESIQETENQLNQIYQEQVSYVEEFENSVNIFRRQMNRSISNLESSLVNLRQEIDSQDEKVIDLYNRLDEVSGVIQSE